MIEFSGKLPSKIKFKSYDFFLLHFLNRIIAKAPAAQLQNTGHLNSFPIIPRNEYTVPPIKIKPIISRILIITNQLPFWLLKKYIILCSSWLVDIYLLIILMFLIAGSIIAITSDPPVIGLFYSMLGGSIIIIIYVAMKSRKEQKELRRQRRRSKK